MHRSYVSHQIIYGPFIDKLLLWIFCIVICYRIQATPFVITYMLLSLAVSCFLSLLSQPLYRHIILFIYFSLCMIDTVFILFFPLVSYDIFRYYPNWLMVVLGLLFLYFIPSAAYLIDFLCLSFLAIALKQKASVLTSTYKESTTLRDNNKEFMMKLEEKNVELMEKQDYEINIATLNERNRIAREIHDNVGHQLTRAILQVGAMQYLPLNETTKQQLLQIKQSLDESMNSIRASVHQLYDDSIDLKLEIEKMVNSFTFCPIHYQYQVHSTLSQKEKLALLAIIKEALTNIAKHSNANQCIIRLKEHPGFIQLKMSDNGTKVNYEVDSGIGLQSISERVHQLTGYCEFKSDHGFHIFISLPKEERA